MSKLPCYYAHGGLNYKNGFATTCPISGARLKMLDDDQVPSEFWNNEQFKEYRKMLDKGEWPLHCHLCKESEEIGVHSMRQDVEADLTHYNPETGEVDFKGLKHIELRFSNACNMACMHCSEVFSSQWGSRLKNYVPDEEDVKHNLTQLLKTEHRWGADDKTKIDLRLSDVYKIVNDLNTNFPNIEKIDFAGGEVLFQKQFFPTLEMLSKHPNAKNIFIFFHTNFNADFDILRLSELLKPFGKSKIKISVDSSDKIYSYFRDGSSDQLTKNLQQFCAVNDFTQVDLVNTTSVYQIMDIKNVYKYFLSLHLNNITTSIVYTPPYINPAIMMHKFKDEVLQDIADTKKMLKKAIEKRKKEANGNPDDYPKYSRCWLKGKQHFSDIETALQGIAEVEKYVQSHKTSLKDWEAFLSYSKKIDKLWKKDFNQHFENYKRIDDNIVRVK